MSYCSRRKKKIYFSGKLLVFVQLIEEAVLEFKVTHILKKISHKIIAGLIFDKNFEEDEEMLA